MPMVGMTSNEGLVAPAILLQVAPLSVLKRHCTVGAGEPVALEVNVTAALFSQVTVLPGFTVTTGGVGAFISVQSNLISLNCGVAVALDDVSSN